MQSEEGEGQWAGGEARGVPHKKPPFFWRSLAQTARAGNRCAAPGLAPGQGLGPGPEAGVRPLSSGAAKPVWNVLYC